MLGLVSPVKGTPSRVNYEVTGTRVKVAAQNGNRKTVMFQNQGSDTVFLGGSNVTVDGATRGYALFESATFTDNGTASEWWAVTAGSTEIVHVVEIS